MTLAEETKTIEELIDSGDGAKAIDLGKKILERYPRHPKVLYLLGLCELIHGKNEQAVHWFEASLKEKENSAICATNLALAYERMGQCDFALKYYNLALKIDSTLVSARYNRGLLLLQKNRPKRAVSDFRWLVKAFPTDPRFLSALADALREMGRYEIAITFYKSALINQPSFERALKNLCKLLVSFNRSQEAIECCRRAIEENPSHFLALKFLGDSLTLEERFDEAMEAYADAYELNNQDADLNQAIGNMWVRAHEYGEAIAWFNAAIQLDEENTAAHCGLIHVLKETGNRELSLQKIQDLSEKHPEDESVLMTMADLLWEEGDAEQAIEYLDRLKQTKPHWTPRCLKSAQILASSGQISNAVEQYREVLENTPTSIPALSGIATSLKAKTDARYIETMQRLLKKDRMRDSSKAQLCSGLAHYYDGVGNYEQAAQLSRQANQLQWASNSKIKWHYEPVEHERNVTETIETFDASYFDRIRAEGFGLNDERPVFIVGMPRSGTTLTEQILARHNRVLGIGERGFASNSYRRTVKMLGAELKKGVVEGEPDLRELFGKMSREIVNKVGFDYLNQLEQLVNRSGKKGVIRVVDKLPDNYNLIGWILTLFPNARILHCLRDPRDIALSCWMTHFGSIPWACNIPHLVSRLEQHQRLMAHWREVIPDRFIEVSYKELVNDQERVSREMLAYLNIEWDPACLTFYESDRLIRTASVTQVRKPIYKTSLGKWRNYKDALGDLFQDLSVDEEGLKSVKRSS